jgi:HAD superfamily hydrolase (TIGR01509 family)
MKILALDAMGVIYSARDDVLELLCPFIAEKGGIREIDTVQRIYVSASLGEISSAEFWKSVKIDPELEDAYLQRHRLSEGLLEFLEILSSQDIKVWGLSNDVSEWSRKLRGQFGLDKYFKGFVVSGDVHIRKPDSLIYRYLLKKSNASAQNIVFVDDQPKNLDVAAGLGFRTLLFEGRDQDNKHNHDVINGFPELFKWLRANLVL